MPAAKSPRKPERRSNRKPAPRRSRKPAAARGPEPKETAIDLGAREIASLVGSVEKHGGAVLSAYRDPFAGTPLVLASLPLKRVEATPFQRDLSKTHADRLADAIGAAGLFLDPVIAVPGPSACAQSRCCWCRMRSSPTASSR
jgi:ParB family transcriptional regulator, chromosome partitioning protein